MARRVKWYGWVDGQPSVIEIDPASIVTYDPDDGGPVEPPPPPPPPPPIGPIAGELWDFGQPPAGALVVGPAQTLKTPADAMDAIKRGNPARFVAIQAGRVYPGFMIPAGAHGLSIGAFGDGAPPVIRDSIPVHMIHPSDDVMVSDLILRPSEDGNGVMGVRSVARTTGLGFHRLDIRGFGSHAITAKSDDLLVAGCRMMDCEGQAVMAVEGNGVNIADTIAHRCGWDGDRTGWRGHGFYTSEKCSGVLIQRCIISHAGFFGWKAEPGGQMEDSIIIGAVVGLGVGADGALPPDYSGLEDALVVNRCGFVGMEGFKGGTSRADLWEVKPPGMGRMTFNDCVVGPPARAELAGRQKGRGHGDPARVPLFQWNSPLPDGYDGDESPPLFGWDLDTMAARLSSGWTFAPDLVEELKQQLNAPTPN